MPMKVQSVRFGGGAWETVQEAAEVEGVSAAAFIRDAAYARAIVRLYINVAPDTPGSARVRFGFALGQALKEHPELVAQLHDAVAEVAKRDGRRDVPGIAQPRLDDPAAGAAAPQST